jgi:N-acetylglucosaminyl-diphospho-decaprenol L-rhamnosyltransferase
MSASPRVAVVMVTYNAREDALRALRSVRATAVDLPLEILLVDNASHDGTVEAVRAQDPAVQIIANAENIGFGRANNQALAHVSAPYVLLLNPDAELQAGALEALVAVLDERAQVAWVGPQTRNSDGTPQISFGPRLTLGNEWRQRRLVAAVRARAPRALAAAELLTTAEHEPDWVSASCALTRIEALRAAGGFDERFFLYEEDVDLCVRLRAAGWRILHSPKAVVVHHLGRSMVGVPGLARVEYQRSHVRYYVKHLAWPQVLGLRLLLAASAAAGFLQAGNAPARRLQRELLRIAIRES